MSDISDAYEHFSSSDDDLEETLDLIQIPKCEGYFEDVVRQMPDNVYFDHFRMSRQKTEYLAEKFAVSQYFSVGREGDSEKISALKFITVFLWYAGNEAYSNRDVADRFNISVSSLHKIIKRLTYFLSNLATEVIRWPDGEEKVIISQHFTENNFPGVIGALDGTHIRIDKPSQDPESYFIRKSFYSIQAQIVCDHKRRIRDIFLGFPGSVHDSRVFSASPLGDHLAEMCGQYHLLGDSAYPCLVNLLTPFRDNGHLTRRQKNYNYLLATNRYIIEHCFGILKQKWRKLYHIKMHKIADIVHFIRACAVLHNICLEETIVIVPENTELPINQVLDNTVDDNNRNGNERRYDIMNRLPIIL
ncbi:unnamed protein product [Acanthoscelides obtectus]|uniref:DDE Tnp4 domain-containing protein n=1 Tax=Acanthoscelides obtectus TaxID=200917 RepID=A0A9P0PGW0_ACAOB|nr:unnamed protein product [Acanthoscelides obtectus]CAK1620956.1 Putative nuclease HARBI1 [Acanthoscelides obtectus]